MARKGQVQIQEEVDTDEEFENYLNKHYEQLICMEVYSEFCGPCLATGNAIRKGKLEIGQDRVSMVKAAADHIEVLSRFKGKSEPVFLFISVGICASGMFAEARVDGFEATMRGRAASLMRRVWDSPNIILKMIADKPDCPIMLHCMGLHSPKGKLTRAMFGANGIELCRILEEELALTQREHDSGVERPKQDISEQLPEECARQEEELKILEELRAEEDRIYVQTLAARKKRVSERLARQLSRLNFILFWPHCHRAYLDLYENWDLLNIQVGAKEEIQITEEMLPEVLYMSDVEPNEACIHALMAGPALVVLFKMFDTDYRDFVHLLRHALYEMVPIPKEDEPPEKQLPPFPAYERYATISKTAREVRRDRYNALQEKLRLEEEERARLEAEQARLARDAEEQRLAEEKQRKEEEKMARIAAGLPASPEPEPEPAVEEEQVPEGLPGEEAGEGGHGGEGEGVQTELVGEDGEMPGEGFGDEEQPPEVEPEPERFHSEVTIEGEEYIPPGGLFVPGLYTPPNALAKANGLKLFFPKIVASITKIETEHLPPHVLVVFPADKRRDVKEIVDLFPDEILSLGIFIGEDLNAMEHVAYTIKQYDKLDRPYRYKDRLAVMVSRKRSLPLLQLASLNPTYISIDRQTGIKDCLTLFPVGYGDDYVEEESIVEEEIVEAPPVSEPIADDSEVVEKKEGDDEDEEED